MTPNETQTTIRQAVAAVEAMTDKQIQAGHESGILDRRYKRPGRCQCSTCTPDPAEFRAFFAGMDAYNDWLKEDETWEEVGGTPGYVGTDTAWRMYEQWKNQ